MRDNNQKGDLGPGTPHIFIQYSRRRMGEPQISFPRIAFLHLSFNNFNFQPINASSRPTMQNYFNLCRCWLHLHHPLSIMMMMMMDHRRCMAVLGILLIARDWSSDAFSVSQTRRNQSFQRRTATVFAAPVITPDVPLDFSVDLNSNNNKNNNNGVGEPETVRALLQDPFLQDATRILLDTTSHPPGTLPPPILSSAFHILHSWARTHSVHGATMVNRILTRLEEEILVNPSASTLELSNKHYTVVRRATLGIFEVREDSFVSYGLILYLLWLWLLVSYTVHRPYKLGDNQDTLKPHNVPKTF